MNFPRLLSCLILLIVCGCTQQQKAPVSTTAQRLSAEQGKKLFAELCTGCHGKQARGGVGPDLTVSNFKYGKDSSIIQKSIMGGRPGGMPSFSSYLKPGDAAALADYLLSLQ